MEGVTVVGQGDLPSLAWMKSAQLDPNAVTVDADGNVFVTGEALTVDLGGGPLMGDPANGYDAFLVSYTKTGKHRWSKRFGGTSYDRFLGLGVDAEGNLYATGEFSPGTDFGDGPLADNVVLVASFTNDGDVRWLTEIDVARAQDLAVMADGVSFVTGDFGATADLGGGVLTGVGSTDGFIGSFSAEGEHRWSAAFGGGGNDSGFTLATDEFGVIVFGTYPDSLAIGDESLVATGGYDTVVGAFDASGDFRWAKTVGGAGTDWAGGVAVSRDGRIYTSGTWGVDGTGSDDESDFFITSFDAEGAQGPMFGPGGPGYAVGTATAITPDDDVIVAGRFAGTTDFGGGQVASINTQAWLASYDAALAHHWSIELDWVGPPAGPNGVAAGPDGEIYLVGQFLIAVEGDPLSAATERFLLQFRQDCF
jgi:hypothetical protein